jgi:hypothetical protein
VKGKRKRKPSREQWLVRLDVSVKWKKKKRKKMHVAFKQGRGAVVVW